MIYAMKRTTKRVFFFSFPFFFSLSFLFSYPKYFKQESAVGYRHFLFFFFSCFFLIPAVDTRHCPPSLSPTLQENWLGPAFVLIKPPSHRRNCQGERPSTHRINSREERKKKKGNPCRFVFLFGPHNGERD